MQIIFWNPWYYNTSPNYIHFTSNCLISAWTIYSLKITVFYNLYKRNSCYITILSNITVFSNCLDCEKVSSSHHLTSMYMYEIWKVYVEIFKVLKLSCQNQSVDKVQLWPWPLDPKFIGIFLLTSRIWFMNMKAVRRKKSKLSCQNQSTDKFSCYLDLWTPKCIGIFLLPSCMYVWNIKAVCWKLLKLLCKNLSADRQCWKNSLVTLTFDPKMKSYRPLTILSLHVCMKSVSWKLLRLSCQSQSVDKFSCDLDLWPSDPNMYSMYEIWMPYVENYSMSSFFTWVVIFWRFLSFGRLTYGIAVQSFGRGVTAFFKPRLYWSST